MKKKTKRCEICSSKLDKKGECPWSGCPASPKYQSEVKDEANPKAKTTNS
nr:MAG TPA: Ariadne-1 protein-like protein [Caudoviricetes sp.]